MREGEEAQQGGKIIGSCELWAGFLPAVIEQNSLPSVRVLGLLLGGMRVLASKIERELRKRQWKHCAIYETDLRRFWPSTEKDREAKIAQFASFWVSSRG